jgi:hypothetical protein
MCRLFSVQIQGSVRVRNETEQNGMGQEALFFEDFRGAIRHLIGALGGPKKVGAILRPTLPVQTAVNWINDCLSTSRDSKFDFEDIVTLLAEGRKRGVHCATWQLSDETGYTRPSIAPPKTRNQERAERMEKLLAEFKHLADEEAAETNLKAVS